MIVFVKLCRFYSWVGFFIFFLYMYSKIMNYNCDILLNLKMVVEKFYEDEVDVDM